MLPLVFQLGSFNLFGLIILFKCPFNAHKKEYQDALKEYAGHNTRLNYEKKKQNKRTKTEK